MTAGFRSKRALTAWAQMVAPAMLAALAGCWHAPADVAAPVALPASFSATGPTAASGKWWTAFGDKDLNALMADALAGNLTLQSAWDRLDAAEAVAARSGAALWPQAGGSGDRVRTVRKSLGLHQTYRTEYSLGLSASYELDLWGRVRATRNAAVLDARASGEDLDAAAISVTAEVARAWYQLIERHGQLAILDDQIETNGKYLEVIQSRFRAGQASAADVLQQKELIESVRGERVVVELAIRVLANQLAVLLGRMPGGPELDVPERLPDLPALPATPVPAEWIRRRPDVRAAELRVLSADRRVAAAIADQFPKLALSVSSDTTDQQVRNLLDNWVAAALANLTAPLLDGGLRRAEVRRTKADAAERLHAYGQVILTSVREVEDALSQEARQGEYVESLRKQLRLSEQATEQTLANYTKGAADFTRYLTTLLSYQRLQRTYLSAERDRWLYRIDLCRALAGSWPMDRRPPTVEPAEPADKIEIQETDRPEPRARVDRS